MQVMCKVYTTASDINSYKARVLSPCSGEQNMILILLRKAFLGKRGPDYAKAIDNLPFIQTNLKVNQFWFLFIKIEMRCFLLKHLLRHRKNNG